MSRSTLCFSLIAELLLAAPAWASGNRYDKCMGNCEKITKQFEKSCKTSMPNGKCDGRGKAMVDDLEKKCHLDCEKRKPKK